MSPKYKEVPCPFCNRTIRTSDRFCIFCGSRIDIENLTATSKKQEIPESEKKELESELNNELGDIWQGVDKNKSQEEDTASAPFLVENKSQEELEDRVIDSKPDSDGVPVVLPDDIKEQLETKMKLSLCDEKKTLLKKKLKNLTENLDEERYEYDMDYAQGVNMKLNAFKTLKKELGEEEENLRKDLGGDFRMDELEELIRLKRDQLIELKRSFKRRHIKKDIYEQLKTEYVEEFETNQKELNELRINIIRWLSKEKAEKNRIEARIRLLTARYKTKEIVKDAYEDQKTIFEKDIERINQRVRILELYSREKKKGKFF
jgi:endogenous inhibitor of DNA gyrase (YacG/DUF329 family)